MAGRIGEHWFPEGCYSFNEAVTLAAQDIKRTGCAGLAFSLLQGWTVRQLLRQFNGIDSGPSWDDAAERRAFRKTLAAHRSRQLAAIPHLGAVDLAAPVFLFRLARYHSSARFRTVLGIKVRMPDAENQVRHTVAGAALCAAPAGNTPKCAPAPCWDRRKPSATAMRLR